MKIAFVSQLDARDVRSWSGLPYYMSRSLEDSTHRVVHLSPLEEKWAALHKAKQLVYRVITRRRHLRDREPLILEGYARQVEERLSPDIDLVFSASTIPIARLRCEQPIVFWTDAAFAGMVDFYPSFSNLTDGSRQAGDAMERAALDRCALAIYSSAWAAETAIEHYGARPEKVRVVPFGANLESTPTADTIDGIVASRPDDRCRLLFIGVEWRRKGGDVAVEVARLLNDAGLDTTLTISGPPSGTVPNLPFVRDLGFVSKNSPSGRRRIEAALAESHFLILPSRADCTPVVLCEANAFGVPCLTTNVGGIPTIVRDGENGQTFAVEAAPDDYCSYILDVFSDGDRYRCLAMSSFREYRLRLNWTNSGNIVKRLLEEVGAGSGWR